MPTSMLPIEFARVPQSILDLSAIHSDMECNPRPDQRPGYSGMVFSDADFIFRPLRRYLRELKPGTKVLLHFQSYLAQDVGTAAVALESIFWAGTIALHFDRPPGFDKIHGAVFWCPFLLAIAQAPETVKPFVRKDRHGRLFLRMLSQFPRQR